MDNRLDVPVCFGAGWLLAAVLLGLAAYLDDANWFSILIWHFWPILSLAGNGPLLGYGADGSPMYEGTPIHLIFAIVGLLAGFVIYPVLLASVWQIVKTWKKRS